MFRRGDAELVADSLVQADLWGHQSRGVMRLPWYTARLDAGAISVSEANDGIGQVAAARAARTAIDLAKHHGIGAVAVRNSGHFGTAMYYSLMAAREGYIGILTTNANPSMAPWGGRVKAVGNNPWSIAAPAGRYAPFALDIANTRVARGKIFLAKQKRSVSVMSGMRLSRLDKRRIRQRR